MAYSMNWRPELDKISETPASSRPLGPIPGLLPTSRFSPPSPAVQVQKAKRTAPPQASSSYSMNWRPPYSDEEDEIEAATVASSSSMPSAQALVTSTNNLEYHDNKQDTLSNAIHNGSLFRLSLSSQCPTVQITGKSAFLCAKDGLACTAEALPGIPSIGVPAKLELHLHPSRADLTHAQTRTLSQVLYSVLYAALCTLKVSDIVIKDMDYTDVSDSVQNALIALDIWQQKPCIVSLSTLVQLHHLAEPHLLTSPFPYAARQSFTGAQKPIAHPARPQPRRPSNDPIYSRWNCQVSDHMCLYRTGSIGNGEQLFYSQGLVGPKQLPQRSTHSSCLHWALEYPALEGCAHEINEYDRYLALPEEIPDAEYGNVLTAITHYAFLTEPRSMKMWITASSELEKTASALEGLGWKAYESSQSGKKGGISTHHVVLRDFVARIEA